MTETNHIEQRPNTPDNVLSEDEIRQRMSDITRRNNEERATLREAYKALGEREARAVLAITFQQPDLFTRDETRTMYEDAVKKGLKLTVEDKKALAKFDVENLQLAFDLAKFDCDTTDKDYSKLEKQLSFYQSAMKLGESNA